jgi:hypothetical protein
VEQETRNENLEVRRGSLSPEAVAVISEALRQFPERVVCAALGTNRHVLARALSPLPSQPGTVALIEANLADGFLARLATPTGARP